MENFFIEATWVVRVVGLWVISRVVGEAVGMGATLYNTLLARRTAKRITELAEAGTLYGSKSQAN